MILKNLLFGTLILLGGCASNLPQEITTPISGSPEVNEVSRHKQAYQYQKVRWGGVIASIENKKDATWVEIISKELTGKGRPKSSDKTSGRFFARIGQLLDPEIYKKGRLVTVYGTLAKNLDGQIGEQAYAFPVVSAKTLYLWAETHSPQPVPYPYYYSRPFYDPYWGVYWDSPWRSRYYRDRHYDRHYRNYRRSKCG